MTDRPDCWTLADAILATPPDVAPRVLLYGPPGTGKTYAGIHGTSAAEVLPVTMTDETPAAEIRGHYVPTGDRWEWMHGPGVLAWMRGATLVVNEIDHASGDALDLMLVLADDPESARLALPTGDVIRPADGFRIVATMNGLPQDLPDAIRDRFSSCAVLIDRPHPDAIAALPEDLRSVAARLAAVPDDDRRIGLRAWMSYARLRGVLSQDLALAAAFADRADEMQSALGLARIGVSGPTGDPEVLPGDPYDPDTYRAAGYCAPCRNDLARSGGSDPGVQCNEDGCPNREDADEDEDGCDHCGCYREADEGSGVECCDCGEVR